MRSAVKHSEAQTEAAYRTRFTPSEPFVPAVGVTHADAQTILAYLLRPERHGLELRRERWDTPDGDFVDLDFLDAPPDRPHLLVLHGMEASSNAGYVIATLVAAAEKGWGAVALNFRSCSGEDNRRLASYCSGDYFDAGWVLETLRARGVRGPLCAVGFSLGANVLLRLLQETGDDSLLSAGVAISAPYDLAQACDTIDGPGFFSAIYRHRFLLTLRKKALSKARRHPGRFDLKRALTARKVRTFDDTVTGPTYGFEGAADYYAHSSAGPRMGQIRRPTLLLSAADDPFIPESTFPSRETLEANPFLVPLLTRYGGHVGFLSGSLVRPRFWAEKQAVEFLANQLG